MAFDDPFEARENAELEAFFLASRSRAGQRDAPVARAA
jgi:hypothetical protein